MKKYIVIASGGIGGAEKRFFDIFVEMRKIDNNVYLVIPSCLFMLMTTELKGKLEEGVIIINMKKWSPLKFLFSLYIKVILRSTSSDSFHYPLNPAFFLHFLPFRRFSLSFCYCYEMPTFSFKNKALLLQWCAAFFAFKIDVLNRGVFNDFVEAFPKFSKKTKLTPGGTFISPYMKDLKKKSRSIVFLSRLEPGKGVERLFTIIPMINALYKDYHSESLSFDIYGVGSLKYSVVDNVDKMQSEGINVYYHGFIDSLSIFPSALAVLSLQEKTNYPSRVVAEALTCGCEVILLNTGDTKDFGEHKGIHYLDKDLGNLNEIMSAIRSSCLNRQKEISIASNERYSSTEYIEYYLDVFEKLS